MGRLERAAMAAILKLKDDAYGLRMADRMKELGLPLSPGQIYVILTRLEDKGFVESHLTDPTPVRGGRAKRVYELTGEGRRALSSEAAEVSAIFGTPQLES